MFQAVKNFLLVISHQNGLTPSSKSDFYTFFLTNRYNLV